MSEEPKRICPFMNAQVFLSNLMGNLKLDQLAIRCQEKDCMAWIGDCGNYDTCTQVGCTMRRNCQAHCLLIWQDVRAYPLKFNVADLREE